MMLSLLPLVAFAAAASSTRSKRNVDAITLVPTWVDGYGAADQCGDGQELAQLSDDNLDWAKGVASGSGSESVWIDSFDYDDHGDACLALCADTGEIKELPCDSTWLPVLCTSTCDDDDPSSAMPSSATPSVSAVATDLPVSAVPSSSAPISSAAISSAPVSSAPVSSAPVSSAAASSAAASSSAASIAPAPSQGLVTNYAPLIAADTFPMLGMTGKWDGCYQRDEGGVDTTDTNGQRGLNVAGTGGTVSTCVTSCNQLGYFYAGVQAGDECWCGYRVPTTLLSPPGDPIPAGCDVPCSQNATEACGGATLQLDVYEVYPIEARKRSRFVRRFI